MTDDRRPPTATTDSGIPAPSDERSLTVGPNGPTVLHDHYLVQNLVANIVAHASDGVTADTQTRVVAYLANVDAELGARVAAGLGHQDAAAAA